MNEMSTAVIKPGWSPLSVLLMIFGFMVFWPLGLFMLAYILWGDEMTRSFKDGVERLKGFAPQMRSAGDVFGKGFGQSSGNAAFDAYRAKELERLEERRRELDAEVRAFQKHIDELKRARDREEFEAYMARRGGSTSTVKEV
jgi:hypothetical protein